MTSEDREGLSRMVVEAPPRHPKDEEERGRLTGTDTQRNNVESKSTVHFGQNIHDYQYLLVVILFNTFTVFVYVSSLCMVMHV